MEANNPLPHLFDENAEKDMIRLIVQHPDERSKAITTLELDDFYGSECRHNFERFLESFREVGDIELHKMKQIAQYTDHNWHVSHLFFPRIFTQLRELARKRKTFFALQGINKGLLELPSGELIEFAMASLSEIVNGPPRTSNEASDIFETISENWEKTKGQSLLGVSTSTFLDEVIFGYQPGHYWVIGAYTNYGKTTYACWLAAQLAAQNVPTAIFSTEMSSEQTLEKIITQSCAASLYQVRNSPGIFLEKITAVTKAPLWIFDNRFSVEAIRLELVSLRVMDKLPKVVFVDFIQNVQSPEKSIYERLTAVTLKLQNLAKELNICIVALSQVSNDGANSPGAVIPFKGSGDIASSADLAVQILRDMQSEIEEDTYADFKIKIRKNRHGMVGKEHGMRLNRKTGVLDLGPVPQKMSTTQKKVKWD